MAKPPTEMTVRIDVRALGRDLLKLERLKVDLENRIDRIRRKIAQRDKHRRPPA